MLQYRVIGLARWLVVVIVALAMMAVGAYALLVGLGWFDGGQLALSSGLVRLSWSAPSFEARAAWCAISALIFVAGGLLMMLGLLPQARPLPKRYMIHKTPGLADYGGSAVTLSARGLAALMSYVLTRVPGVHEAEPQIKLTRQGWVVRCRLYVWAESKLPELVEQVRGQLKAALEGHTGIPVVRIDVDADYHSWQHEGQRRLLR